MSRNADSSSEDPTLVLKVFEDFKNSRRQSLLGQQQQLQKRKHDSMSSAMTHKARKLDFQESDEEEEDNKRQRWRRCASSTSSLMDHRISFGAYGPNPLEGLTVMKDLENRRTKNPSGTDPEKWKMEINKLKMQLVEKEADIVQCKVQNQRFEAHLKALELQVRKEKLKFEEEEEKRERSKREENEERERLRLKIQTLEQKLKERSDDESGYRRASFQKRYDLEDVNNQLEKRNIFLQGELNALKGAINAKERHFNEQLETMRRERKMLRDQLDESMTLRSTEGANPGEVTQLRQQLEEAQLSLRDSEKEKEILQSELRQNEDTVIERNAMRERLNKYPVLVKEIERLKRDNNLMKDTVDNVELLKQQVEDLKQQLERAESRDEERVKLENEYKFIQEKNRKWQEVCIKILPSQERSSAPICPETLDTKLAAMQQTELTLRDELNSLNSRLKEQEQRFNHNASSSSALDEKIQKLKKDNEEQSRLIKRFQRKLLLLSKERDSYRGVLESYEHELTFTGGQFEKDRVTSMEKIVLAHKEMIEKLEEQLKRATEAPSSDNIVSESERLKQCLAQTEELKRNLQEMTEKKEMLQMELDRRHMRGDFDPTDTKVLHFRNNPLASSTIDREKQVQSLREENEGLKARVQLLEEGQTKDLTLLVGHKMEEGTSSQEVQNLKEQLQSAEIRKERIIEAFKKTSHDFREVCFQLTGFRIDGLNNNQYKLTPIYAESQDDSLLFKRDPQSGECQLLGTAFSQQLTDLIDLHLTRQHSIPVFLAALITDLFSRQTFDTQDMGDEEDEEEEEEEVGEEEDDDVEEEEEEGGGDDDDPICID